MARKTFTGTLRYPQAWNLIGDILYDIHVMCKARILICIKSRLTRFLTMTPKDTNNAASYLATFVSSGAPEALVKLYKVRAYDFIRYFITSSKDELRKPIYNELFAPLVLEFCKLLRKAVTQDDALYIFCRASLGSMLNKTGIISVQDIFPFVDELATKLSQGSVSSRESIGPSLTHLLEFNNFLRFMMNAVVDPKALDTLVPMRYYQKRPWYDHRQLGYLYSLYLILMANLQTRLTEMVDDIEVIRSVKQDGGWDQYLPILKQLHFISQLYEGAEETFWTILRPNKSALCHLVIRYAKKGDEQYNWILNHKDLTDFESRRHLVMMLVPKVTHDYDNGHKMRINRPNLLAESFQSINGADPSSLCDPLSIVFTNEEEATGNGVLRECS
ncbi:E3 ubiquitin protein ligase UPL5-like protein [Tanacetum coccineum]